MDLFVIDKVGESDLLQSSDAPLSSSFALNASQRILSTSDDVSQKDASSQEELHYEDDDDSGSDFGDLAKNTIDLTAVIRVPNTKPKSTIDLELEEFNKFIKLNDSKSKTSIHNEDIAPSIGGTNVAEVLKNSIANTIEQHKTIENLSEKKKAKLKKLEQSKTKGKNWFNLPATEMTEEVKQDLEVIQMRSVLNPQQFYKKNDLKVLPKYFQVGKVLPSPLDYYSERGERKTKKKTIVDELMNDAQFQRFNKRKYGEALAEKRQSGYSKANKKMKKLKKNK